MLKQHARHSSVRCPHGRVLTVWVMQSEASQKGTPTPLSFRLMGSEHMITCSEGSILTKLMEVPALRPMLPLVRAAVCSQPSRYWWQDESGHRHEIQQFEGGEQGDPLMPLLVSPAIHNALEEAKREMVDGEEWFVFLDDIYILCSPIRTRFLYNVIREKLLHMAGIQLHTGKTRCWNSAGVCPLGIGDLGPDVWSPRGVKVLGTPVCSRRVCARNQRFEVGGRAETLGRHPLNPRPSLCLAGSIVVRGSKVPPFPPNHASKRICGRRTSSRQRDAQHLGIPSRESPWN